MSNIKRDHHYVWRHYLEAWEVGGKLIWLRNGKLKSINAVKIAFERDFYRLPEFNEAEIRYIILSAQSLPAHGEAVFNRFIEVFTAHSRIKALLSGLSINEKEANETLRTYQSNTQEDYYEAIESTAIPILFEIKNGDVSFYVDRDRSASFMYYIANQLMRTKKLRDSQNTGAGEKFGVDLAKVWQVISHFVAANLGCNLYMRRLDDPITLIVNETDIGLITGDQPVVNLYAGKPRALNELAVYYPVSPTRAILFGDLDNNIPVPIWKVNNEQVRRLNRLMQSAAHTMAFARSEKDFDVKKPN